jgi:hypothetical protein
MTIATSNCIKKQKGIVTIGLWRHITTSNMDIISTYPLGSMTVVCAVYKGHDWEFECDKNWNIKYAFSLTAEDHPTDDEYKQIENYIKKNL